MTHRCTGAGGEMGLATGFHLRGVVATLSAVLVLADSSGAAMAGTTEVAGVSSRSETEWKWALNASEVRSVNVNFVRATIEILPSEGSRIEVLVTHPHDQVGGEALMSSMRLAVSSANGRYHIEDRYPAQSAAAYMDECLPPRGDRGAFWHYARPLKVRLFVPRRLSISAHTMAGSVNDRRWPDLEADHQTARTALLALR